jgi:hypothetical protein
MLDLDKLVELDGFTKDSEAIRSWPITEEQTKEFIKWTDCDN